MKLVIKPQAEEERIAVAREVLRDKIRSCLLFPHECPECGAGAFTLNENLVVDYIMGALKNAGLVE